VATEAVLSGEAVELCRQARGCVGCGDNRFS
jgi:hypothetical protein